MPWKHYPALLVVAVPFFCYLPRFVRIITVWLAAALPLHSSSLQSGTRGSVSHQPQQMALPAPRPISLSLLLAPCTLASSALHLCDKNIVAWNVSCLVCYITGGVKSFSGSLQVCWTWYGWVGECWSLGAVCLISPDRATRSADWTQAPPSSYRPSGNVLQYPGTRPGNSS